MIGPGLDIAGLVSMLESERIDVPVVACGVGDDKGVAVRAIKSEREYIPLPPDAELISAVLEAVSQENYSDHPQRPSYDEGVGIGQTGCKKHGKRFGRWGPGNGQGINGPIYP